MPNPPLDSNLFADLPESPGLPTSADKLFASQEDWWNNACLNWSSSGWSLYAEGYKEAADLLVAQVEARNGIQDTLVYPILFLYRQYLELQIKDTLRMARHLKDISGDPPAHHRIDQLWRELHTLLLQIFPGESVAELVQIGRLLQEFAAVDPLSMAFRYPVDKQGNPSLPGIARINLRNVRDVIAKVAIILAGVNSETYENLQFKLEQQREFDSDSY